MMKFSIISIHDLEIVHDLNPQFVEHFENIAAEKMELW